MMIDGLALHALARLSPSPRSLLGHLLDLFQIDLAGSEHGEFGNLKEIALARNPQVGQVTVVELFPELVHAHIWQRRVKDQQTLPLALVRHTDDDAQAFGRAK